MKTPIFTLIGSVLITAMSLMVNAQEKQIQFFRPNDKTGINIFETSKKDSVPFKALK